MATITNGRPQHAVIRKRAGRASLQIEQPIDPGFAPKHVAIFADGASLDGISELARNPVIRGFTTNPTLMRAASVADYEGFARKALLAVDDRPISLEVFADDFDEMRRQALRLSGWGENVFVKIPVTDTTGRPTVGLVADLSEAGVRLNVTALFTPAQVRMVSRVISASTPAFVSVFAGRIADSGRDPVPIMRECLRILAAYPHVKLIWASPREVLNVVQADEIRCDVITVTHDLLKKLTSVGKDLDQFSLETVRMFRNDALAAGYTL